MYLWGKSAEVNEQDSDSENEDPEDTSLPFTKKSKSKRKSGRRPKWNNDDVDDMVDIIVNSDYYKRKLIFTNTKNQRNGEIYGQITTIRNTRKSNKEEFKIYVQYKPDENKIQKCISECKNVPMTIKTATGTKRFQDSQGYGKWFPTLFAVVKTRESCQPEQAIEPSPSPSPCSSLGTLSKSLRRPLLRQPEVEEPKNDAVRMLQNDLAP